MKRHNEILKKIEYIFNKYPREYYLLWMFAFIWFLIVIELFSFTILNHSYYQSLATRQQTSQTKTPINRWTIYSSNEKWNVLAVWVDLNDLAIDPMVEWNKEKLSDFLTDIVYNEICYTETSTECRKSLSKFLWVLEVPDFRMNESFLKWKIEEKVSERINRTKVTSVLLKDSLTNEQSFEIDKLNISWVYVNWTYLYVNPEEVVDDSFVASKLGAVIWWNIEDIKHSIRKRSLRYVIILNRLSIWTSEYIKQKITEEQQAISKWFIDKKDTIWSFLILSPNPNRFYPEWTMASNVLWFVSNWVWNYWIEWYYDNILRWKQAQTFSKKDIAWRSIEPVTLEEQTDLAWANITLTIDRNIQKAIEDIIDVDLSDYQANNISAVVMDPKTWAVLAMATNPRYDLNNPWEAFELEKVTPDKFPNPYVNLIWTAVMAVDNRNWKEYYYDWKKLLLREAQREELSDRSVEKYVFTNRKWWWVYKNDIIQDLYEPWSIFKPIVFAAAIDSWEINRFDMYKDEWYVKIDRFTIKNVSSKCLWYNTFQNAMSFSCNVWMIRIAQKIWASIFYKYLESFWIWRKTWVTLEWEVFGRLDPYEKWSKAQLFTTSFWQWITTTMLQMASVYSVLANWWVYYTPQIVKSIEFADGRTITYKPEADHRVLKETTSKTMTDVLVESVNKWVAKLGWVKWYSIAWKTWTAQIAYKWQYESWQASTMWFYAWYGPAEDPKFVIIVKVERPRSSIYGWETVARTFSRIAQYLLDYYKVPPKK